MTSYIINAHKARTIPRNGDDDTSFCAFCRIIQDGARAYKVYETDYVIAILDILPIRQGHVLVIPKQHYKHLSDLPPDIASALGAAVTKVANAITKAMDNTGLNVVCNQEYAQAVPHVHYRIVPAPTITTSTPALTDQTLSLKEMHRREFLARQELDDDLAASISHNIRSKL